AFWFVPYVGYPLITALYVLFVPRSPGCVATSAAVESPTPKYEFVASYFVPPDEQTTVHRLFIPSLSIMFPGITVFCGTPNSSMASFFSYSTCSFLCFLDSYLSMYHVVFLSMSSMNFAACFILASIDDCRFPRTGCLFFSFVSGVLSISRFILLSPLLLLRI